MAYITSPELLALEVQTRNRVNQVANFLRREAQNLLTLYVGRKVVKVTPYRAWTSKVQQQLDLLPIPAGFRLVWEMGYGRRIYATLDTTYPMPDGHSVQYVKQDVFVCLLEPDEVTLSAESHQCEDFRTDYTIPEIQTAWDQARQYEEAASALRSQIREFLR
jgi:hypothetical protein